MEEFWQQTLQKFKQQKHQRMGQLFMNELYAQRADLYTKVTGTDADTFYEDWRLYLLRDWLTNNW